MIYSDDYWKDVQAVCECIPNLQKLYNKKILVTGASGMICSSVVEILDYLNKTYCAQIDIVLAGRSKKRLEHRFPHEFKYTYLPYDATKATNLDIYTDYIIHGASNANPVSYLQQPVETMLGNFVGLNSLLELAKKNKSRLLYISSSEVYGKKAENKPFKEEDYGLVEILNLRSCYPNGKRSAETLCVAYDAEYDVDTVIVRPGHVYGPTITESDTRASAQFTRNVLKGEQIVMKSAGNQLRSYCYTLDCASAILSVLINGKKSTAYNISNRSSIVTILEFAKTLARHGQTKIIFENPTYTESKGYNFMQNSSLDSKRLELLGWSACFNLELGIKRTLEVLNK